MSQSLAVLGEAEGWPRGFVDFYCRHFPGLVRMAAALVGRVDIAEEVTQEAMLGLGQRWDEVSAPYGYVRRSVVNASYDHLRRLRHQRLFRRRQRPESAQVDPPEVDETLRLLEGLSPRRQVALALRFHLDLGYEEIAELMDCKEATARSLVHRGLRQLRRRMS